MKLNFERGFKPTQKEKDTLKRENSEQREGTLEKIGNSLIELGRKLKEHPSVEKVKTIIRELGRDMKALFGLVEKSEEKEEEMVEKDGYEEREERESLMRKIRKAIKPYMVWGIMLTGMRGNAMEEFLPSKNHDRNVAITQKVEKEKEKEIPRTIQMGFILYADYRDENFNANMNRYGGEEVWFDGREEDFKKFKERILNNKELLYEIKKKFFNKRDEQKRGIDIEQMLRKEYEILKKYMEYNRIGRYMYYYIGTLDDFESFNKTLGNDPEFIKSAFYKKAIEDINKKYNGRISKEKKRREFFEKLKELHFDLKEMKNKLLKEGYLNEIFDNIKDLQDEYEKRKIQLEQKIKSEAYLQRLAQEVNGNIEEAKKIQQERIKSLRNSVFYISNQADEVEKGDMGMAFEVEPNSRKWGFAVGFALRDKNAITHELNHVADKGGKNIPDDTKRKLDNNYSFEKRQTQIEKEIGDEYYRRPTEILARKAVFDTKLEELGIKKYEEEFTEEHYKKVKKLLEEGKLDRNSSEFFRMFEKDALIMIMNTVAYQDAVEKGVPIDQGKLAEELIAKIMKVNELNKKGDTYYPPEFWVNSGTT